MTDDAKLIERLREENERLRGALEPFAMAARIAKNAMAGPADIGHLCAIAERYIVWDDFKRARAALSSDEGGRG